MWEPTHVQVTVQRGSSLLIKGKNGTNDCFVTIALGSTKYQTSVKEKAKHNIDWHEECELPIPDQGNTAEIILTALHRNFIGYDEFLGRVAIKLNSFDVYESPRNRWYKLRSKPGKEGKEKERGELEVKVAFTVKSGSLSNISKKEKHRSSLSQIASNVGGSLLSVGGADRRKSIKNIAMSIGSKMHLKGRKHKDSDYEEGSSVGSVGSLKRRTLPIDSSYRKQTKGDADPGVVSDEDDFTFDDLSHKSSGSSLNVPSREAPTPNGRGGSTKEDEPSPEIVRRHTTSVPSKPPRTDSKTDEWELKLYGKPTSKNTLKPIGSNNTDSIKRRSWDSPKLSARIDEEDVVETPTPLPTAKPEESTAPAPTTIVPSSFHVSSPKTKKSVTKSPEPAAKTEKDSVLKRLSKFRNVMSDKGDVDKLDNSPLERIIIGGENDAPVSTHKHISNELMQKFEGKSREDLILLMCNMQSELDHNRKKLKDLEDYLDNLLLRVMETTPRILQNPYVHCKLAHKSITG